MSELFIHIGHSKAGSSAIQRFLRWNLARLHENGFDVLTGDLRSSAARGWEGNPLWHLQTLRQAGAEGTRQALARIVEASRFRPSRRIILSAENLANPSMEELMAGVDYALPTTILFYVRSQAEWLPSAWKQWGLKDGTPLMEYVSRKMALRQPDYLATASRWREALPKARLIVRLLHEGYLHGGDVVSDFCNLVGISMEGLNSVNSERANTSFDHSLLTVMSRNPDLFDGPHDNRLYSVLATILNAKYKSVNIKFFSTAQLAQIEKCYHDPNRELLARYCGLADGELDKVYEDVFGVRQVERSYGDLTDIDTVYRCLGILLETLTQRCGEVAQGKPPQSWAGKVTADS